MWKSKRYLILIPNLAHLRALQEFAESVKGYFYNKDAATDAFIDRIYSWHRYEKNRGSMIKLLSYSLKSYTDVTNLDRIKIPTLILRGDKDNIALVEFAHRFDTAYCGHDHRFVRLELLWYTLGGTITAALFAKLVERGDASWGVPVIDLFPDLRGQIDPAWGDRTIDDVFHCRRGMKANLSATEMKSRREETRGLGKIHPTFSDRKRGLVATGSFFLKSPKLISSYLLEIIIGSIEYHEYKG